MVKVCSICNSELFDKTALKNHMRSHTGAKPFVCLVCGDCFTQNVTLRNHVRSKHEKKRLKCLQCSKEYTDPRTLRRHVKSVHPNREFGLKESMDVSVSLCVNDGGVYMEQGLGSRMEDGCRRSGRVIDEMACAGDDQVVLNIIEKDIYRDLFCIKDAGVSPSGVAKGNGVFAKQWIPQGLICINYDGDFITDRKVIDSRRDQYTVAKAESWYILTFSYVLNSGESSRAVRGWYDAHPEEYKHTFGRSMNHSREHPNLIGRLKFFKGQPRLLFETLRPIKEGEELVWDYGDKGLDAPEWMRV